MEDEIMQDLADHLGSKYPLFPSLYDHKALQECY